ncbi:MAG: cytochrome c oxidase accessory protein CcoG [Myxococcales bacterium]|nr:cytochrome c oxidase accessory protein CcoG [Polyangiaceae bacterium]MDW8248622.1 cytochrome c oxidase accessory protein CcoG [Myxococcales bacterium]
MAPRHQLPTLDSVPSLNADGSRRFVHPAEVSGRYNRLRRITFAFLFIILFAVPWIKVDGRPAVLLDIPRRQFFLFGEIFNAQDGWMLLFFAGGLGLFLLLLTTLSGRLWCGFACPQTVMIEGVFRVIERWIEGPREARLKLERAPWNVPKVVRKGIKHALFLAMASLLAHTILGYFIPLRSLWSVLADGPRAHLEAFLWTLALTALFYFDFGWFREQFCIIMCPYGRLQSVLTDAESLVVGYDVKRGEPRGKLNALGNGDCVDCKRCIAVCPTAIDIRQGLQLDCIGCTACIDACDAIMDKVHKPRGLIRLDSLKGFAGERTRLLRLRTVAYAAGGLLGLVLFTLALGSRTAFAVNLLRPTGAPFTVEGAEIRNVYRLKLVSKRSEPSTLTITPSSSAPISFVVSQPQVTLPPLGSLEVPVIAALPADHFQGPVQIILEVASPERKQQLVATFLGPGR